MALPVAGTQQAFAAKLEASFDTPLAFGNTDCVALESLELSPEQTWLPSGEHIYMSPDLVDEIRSKRGGTWTAKAYIRCPAAGSAPDLSAFWQACAMDQALTPATSAVFAMNADQPRSLQLVRQIGDSVQEVANGAWVESVDLEIVGGGIPVLMFSGRFASYGGLRGTPVVEGAVLAGQATVVLEAGSANLIRRGAQVAFGAEDNAGAGYTITDVADDGVTCTISPVLAGNISDADEVTPVYPAAPATPGTILNALDCGLDIGGDELGFISAKIKYATGIHGLDKEATTDRANRICLGAREVTGELEFYLLDENAQVQVDTWEGTSRAVSIRVGSDVASERFTWAMPACRFNVAPLTVPETDEVTFTSSFVAKRSAAPNDVASATYA